MEFHQTVSQTVINQLLSDIEKPARYVGGELNSVVKDDNVRARAALLFPDVYEVAESHIGLKILYHIINQEKDFAAERVYAMWPDLEKLSRDKKVPLWSLETKRPLAMFDLIGVTLQYELSYPTLLAMLHHGGVTLRAEERGKDEPFVIGGGAGAFNPEPIADFFDGFLLGDGEEAIRDIMETLAAGREREASREEILLDLARIPGMYIPQHYEIEYDGIDIHSIQAKAGTPYENIRSKHGTPRITRRTVVDLNAAPYPTKPIVPNIEPVHGRVSIEIQRGCSQACRFCQAGMITRPTRQRKPEKVLELAQESLKNSGSNEIGLLSLSAGDYAPINHVLSEFFGRYAQQKIGISLPSMRTETMTPELAEQVASVRKSGFTFAPEAGSERMRNVINKTNSEENLMNAVRATVNAGWRSLKFYFMIGLPTETEVDVDAIAHLGERARAEGRKIRPDVDVTVSVSTFVPKPHTSFQWERQISIDETKAKHDRLRQRLKKSKIGFRYHSPEQSFLEGVLSRGDRRLGKALLQASLEGSRLDGWTEHHNHELWVRVLEEVCAEYGLQPEDYLEERPEKPLLPWDHLDAGILKKFLIRDRKKSYEAATIGDCAFEEHCYACGGCDLGDPYTKRKDDQGGRLVILEPDVLGAPPDNNKKLEPELNEALSAMNLVDGEPVAPMLAKPTAKPIPEIVSRLRFRFAKVGGAVHFSHLDSMGQILRAIRQAEVPVLYSQGFNPRAKVSFSPACPTGIESLGEYFEIECEGKPDPRRLAEKINPLLPEGIFIVDADEVPWATPSVSELIEAMQYRVVLPENCDRSALRTELEEFMASEEYLVAVRRKRKKRVLDARRQVVDMGISGEHLMVTNRFQRSGSMKISEILALLMPEQNIRHLQIRKEETFLAPERCPDIEPIDFALESVLKDLSELHDSPGKQSSQGGRRREYMTVPYAE